MQKMIETEKKERETLLFPVHFLWKQTSSLTPVPVRKQKKVCLNLLLCICHARRDPGLGPADICCSIFLLHRLKPEQC